jgi:hypothetical protein
VPYSPKCREVGSAKFGCSILYSSGTIELGESDSPGPTHTSRHYISWGCMDTHACEWSLADGYGA